VLGVRGQPRQQDYQTNCEGMTLQLSGFFRARRRRTISVVTRTHKIRKSSSHVPREPNFVTICPRLTAHESPDVWSLTGPPTTAAFVVVTRFVALNSVTISGGADCGFIPTGAGSAFLPIVVLAPGFFGCVPPKNCSNCEKASPFGALAFVPPPIVAPVPEDEPLDDATEFSGRAAGPPRDPPDAIPCDPPPTAIADGAGK
jgi:hypothetical protein